MKPEMRVTIFIAISLHILLILGIIFFYEPVSYSSSQLDVTLIQHNSDRPDNNVTHVASFDQSGDQKINDFGPQNISDEKKMMTHKKQSQEMKTKTDNISKNENQPSTNTINSHSKIDFYSDLNEPPTDSLLKQSLEFARYDETARWEKEQENNRMYSQAATRHSLEAYYIKAWEEKVYDLATSNIPHEIKKSGITVKVRVAATILPDGHLEDVKLLQSSGHKIVDDSVIMVIKLAAPYGEFPASMGRQKLKIERTIVYTTD